MIRYKRRKMNSKRFTDLILEHTGKTILFKTKDRYVRIDISTLNTFRVLHGSSLKDVEIRESDLNFKDSNDRFKWRIREIFDVKYVERVWVIENPKKYLDEGIEDEE